MDWHDQGILLSARSHGETSAIIEVFTESRGRHAGVVRGGTSRKVAPILQPGAQLDVRWRARLEDHIGSFSVEPIRSRAAKVMSDRMALAGLNAVTALVLFCLPEREAQAQLYQRTEQLLDLLGQSEIWPLAYLRWEMSLLETMGFGLDLTRCAVSGQVDDLIYVSPKSGRAVARGKAGDWTDRMLPLPPVMRGEGAAPDEEVLQGLQTTGYFLLAHVAAHLGHKPLPEARERFIQAFVRRL